MGRFVVIGMFWTFLFFCRLCCPLARGEKAMLLSVSINQSIESNLTTPDLTCVFFSFRGRFGAVVDQNDIDEAVAHVCQKLEEKRGSSNTGGGGEASNSTITQT